MRDRIEEMVMAGFGRRSSRHRAIMTRALAAIEGGNGWDFDIGQPVHLERAEAGWRLVVVARYVTTKGERRYVLEEQSQDFQIIALPQQLRPASATPPLEPPSDSRPNDIDPVEFQRRTEAILARLRLALFK